jgi:hypothetical protein
MKMNRFDPPGQIDDLAGDQASLQAWSGQVGGYFDTGVARVAQFISPGTPQIYNPVTHGITDPDTVAPITWNGFPRRFISQQAGQPPDFASAEPTPLPAGNFRPQDEYLEWHVTRNAAGRIVSVQFTCEGPDYWEFLGQRQPDRVLALYRQFINPAIQRQDLFDGDNYQSLNRFNTTDGAMHLTHPANNLFAEVQLAADATVRRRVNGVEPATAPALIECAQFGDEDRNSDPNIGFQVNQLARLGFMITLQNPVGLYIDRMNEGGFALEDGTPVQGGFRILRGSPGMILRAEYRLPDALATSGRTVSDVFIGGQRIQFGGQIAQRVTMKLTGVACRQGQVHNALSACGAVPFLADAAAPAALAVDAAAPRRFALRGER